MTALLLPTRCYGLFPPVLYPVGRQPWEAEATPADIVEIARTAERAGFSFIGCGDHGVIHADELGRYGSARFYDAVTTLGFLAGQTERIGLAPLVLQVHLRSPFITAKELATLDCLSGGRLIAGFGVGSRTYEAEVAGVDFARRGAVADDHLAAIVELWTESIASHDGPVTRFDGVMCEPRPVQRPRPPIWIGGNRPVGLRRALNRGDGWVPFGLDDAELRTIVASVDADTDLWGGRRDDFRVVGAVAPLGLTTTDAVSVIDAQLGGDGPATDLLVDLSAPSKDALLEAIEWFGADVAPAAGLNPLTRKAPSSGATATHH